MTLALFFEDPHGPANVFDHLRRSLSRTCWTKVCRRLSEIAVRWSEVIGKREGRLRSRTRLPDSHMVAYKALMYCMGMDGTGVNTSVIKHVKIA